MNRERWSSNLGFVLVAGGAAAGLGNIWKFPYIVAENGGGAFVIVYLLCIAMVGLPILFAEFSLGRLGDSNLLDSIRSLARQHKASDKWNAIAWLGLMAVFLVLSVYSVVGGWSLAFLYAAAVEGFGTDGAQSPADFGKAFKALASNPTRSAVWCTLFMIPTISIVAGGIRTGIERVSKLLMPLLMAMLATLIVYGAVATGEIANTFKFLFSPDFEKLTATSVLEALGHAFFTLSVGVGAMLAFGSYLPKNINLFRATLTIVGLDTLIALAAGLAIFPVMLANSVEPTTGPGLVFVTLPIVFSEMAEGQLIGSFFFLLLAAAALTSSPSMLEPIVGTIEDKTSLSRKKTAWLVGSAIWLVAMLQILSMSGQGFGEIFGTNLFDITNYALTSLFLPLGGLLFALFAGWVIPEVLSGASLGPVHPGAFWALRLLLRFAAPTGVAIILVTGVVL